MDYVDQIVPTIAGSWDCGELVAQVDSESDGGQTRDRLQASCATYAAALGPLREYGGSRRTAASALRSGDSRVMLASYAADAWFEQGRATIEVATVERDGRRNIVRFRVTRTP